MFLYIHHQQNELFAHLGAQTHTHTQDHIDTHTCLVITPISQLSEAERVYGSFMGGEAALGSPFGCPYK